MKQRAFLVLVTVVGLLLGGCAGQTTDPRQGGLFSYNPEAYEQRLENRRQDLSQVEQENQRADAESKQLAYDRDASQEENARLRRQVKNLSASINKLEKDIKGKNAKSMAQKQEQHRLLAELRSLKASSRKSDFIENPEEKRLELKRLQQRRDQLEKEAASLMRL